MLAGGKQVAAGTTRGRLFAVSSQSGETLWKLDLEKALRAEDGLEIYSSAAAHAGAIFVGTMNGELVRLGR